MATRRRTTTRRTSRSRRTGAAFPDISQEVVRSIVGIVLLVAGAVMLIALILPGQGRLTDVWRDLVAPWLGSGRWLLPFILLGAGAYVERVERGATNWTLTLLGILIAYLGLLGVMAFFGPHRGGRIGAWEMQTLSGLITKPGAFVVLFGVGVAGVLLTLDMSLPNLLAPVRRFGAGIAAALTRPAADERPAQRPARAVPIVPDPPAPAGRGGNGYVADLPPPATSEAPVSQTVWSARSGPSGGESSGGRTGGSGVVVPFPGGGGRSATAIAPSAVLGDAAVELLEASDA
ncbi:MAG TPA: hypothetical protein VEG29_02715, partial [Candidatus Binatia bacterium]|nr:hypothetical protein [Candidatus Binatia bacterium]